MSVIVSVSGGYKLYLQPPDCDCKIMRFIKSVIAACLHTLKSVIPLTIF